MNTRSAFNRATKALFEAKMDRWECDFFCKGAKLRLRRDAKTRHRRALRRLNQITVEEYLLQMEQVEPVLREKELRRVTIMDLVDYVHTSRKEPSHLLHSIAARLLERGDLSEKERVFCETVQVWVEGFEPFPTVELTVEDLLEPPKRRRNSRYPRMSLMQLPVMQELSY